QVLGIERIRRHAQLASLVPPLIPCTVGIDLDPQPVGVSEVQRLTHEMIRHAGVGADLSEVGEKPPERRTVGKQDREMEESQPAALWDRTRSGPLIELDDG